MSRRVWLEEAERDSIVAFDRPQRDGLERQLGAAWPTRVGDHRGWRVRVGLLAVTTRTRWGARRRLLGLAKQLLDDEATQRRANAHVATRRAW